MAEIRPGRAHDDPDAFLRVRYVERFPRACRDRGAYRLRARVVLRLAGTVSGRLGADVPGRGTHGAHRSRPRRAGAQPAPPDDERGRHRDAGRPRGRGAGGGGHRFGIHRTPDPRSAAAAMDIRARLRGSRSRPAGGGYRRVGRQAGAHAAPGGIRRAAARRRTVPDRGRRAEGDRGGEGSRAGRLHHRAEPGTVRLERGPDLRHGARGGGGPRLRAGPRGRGARGGRESARGARVRERGAHPGWRGMGRGVRRCPARGTASRVARGPSHRRQRPGRSVRDGRVACGSRPRADAAMLGARSLHRWQPRAARKWSISRPGRTYRGNSRRSRACSANCRGRPQLQRGGRHAVDERGVVFDEDHGGRVLEDHFLDGLPRVDVDEVQRLVPEEQVRRGKEGARQLDLLALAGGHGLQAALERVAAHARAPP